MLHLYAFKWNIFIMTRQKTSLTRDIKVKRKEEVIVRIAHIIKKMAKIR